MFTLQAVWYGMNSNGTDWKSFTHIEHRAGWVGREDLVNQTPDLTPQYLLPSQWIPVLAPTDSLLWYKYKFKLHQSVAQNLSDM